MADSAISGPRLDLDGDGLDLVFESLTGGQPWAADNWNHLRIEFRELDGIRRPVLVARISRSITRAFVDVQTSPDLQAAWAPGLRFTSAPPTPDAAPVLDVTDLGPCYEVTFDASALAPGQIAAFRQRGVVESDAGGVS